MTDYDIVIIGGGLGGLVSGLILSKEGLKVCVLEQHLKAGGNMQTFRRDGCIFDTGMHYLGSMDEGQYLHKYFKYFGLTNKLRLKKLDHEGFDTFTFDNDDMEYQVDQGYEAFKQKLLKYFPREQTGIERYITKLQAIVQEFPLYNVSPVRSYKINPDLLEECASGFIRSATSNERLRNILAGAVSLYADHHETTPLYTHACMRDSLINSCWRPIDGSQQIADHMAEIIRENGGSVLLSHKVNKIEIENDIVQAVILNNGEKVYGKHFISNAHPARTLEMIDEGKIKKVYRNRIMNLENTQGVFTVYAILKKNSFPYLNKNYFHYNKDGILHARQGDQNWPDNYYFYTPATSNTEVNAESIVILSYMKYEEVSKWKGSKVNKRGAEYEEFKQRKAELLIDALEKRLPGIREKIVKYYTSTPLTFEDYTGTVEGSAYGIIKDCHDPFRSMVLPRTKISNLFFAGQNINLHGILGVTASAVITCSEIVGLEYLTKKISNG